MAEGLAAGELKGMLVRRTAIGIRDGAVGSTISRDKDCERVLSDGAA